MAMTPMMQQYREAKTACGDALLLFRMGDFYELFYEDAKIAAQQLGLTLTSRDKGENPIPMAGFPHHQLDAYLGKLIRSGFRAAVCEQVEDPRKAKGLVKREVTRVVTPGTLTDDSLLDPRQSNYLAAIAEPAAGGGDRPDSIGLAWAELSTGRFLATVTSRAALADQLARISPSECLVSDQSDPLMDAVQSTGHLTERPPWAFARDNAQKTLAQHFQTAGLDGFGFGDADGLAVRAAGAVLDYLSETQKSSLDHIDRLTPYHAGQVLEIDEATRRSLELTRTIRDGSRAGSLLAVLDCTVTSMGSRLLADWLASPSMDIQTVNGRLDAVEELSHSSFRESLRQQLRGVYDLERLVARVATGRASPRDLKCTAMTLESLPEIKAKLSQRSSELVRRLEAELDLCPELCVKLQEAIGDDPPITAREGGFIRKGFSQELDALRELAAGGKQWIAAYQAREAGQTGISNLKVGFNKVFGYYIEVTNAHRDKAPPQYIRKQTLKNAERYITPELKEYEERVLSADEQAKDLEYDLFLQLRQEVHAAASRLRATGSVIAQLDVLAAFAELAGLRGYCRPTLVDDAVLELIESRHPVLDMIEPDGTFVPNDCSANADDGMILLITGPNMAGKSTYIRQVALLTIMAQMGCFVPAKKATIGIADRVFARVGASDELSRGQSTFMVEMTETARILNNASSRSLVILDEIGRGTSTYDGISLAWAIIEHIHDQIGCRTLFATHYHELTDLRSSLSGIKNLNVAVKEWQDKVVFLHQIVDGAADKSYGIHVARLAGVPKSVNERAKQILAQLEDEHLADDGRAKIGRQPQSQSRGDIQLTLFAPYDHPLLDQIRKTDVERMTPLDALQTIRAWQEHLEGRVVEKQVDP